MTQEAEDKTVSDEALAWFARLQSGDATPDERRRFEAWRACSPFHARAFDRVSAVWDDLDGLKGWADRELVEKKTGRQQVPVVASGAMHKHGVPGWGAFLVAVLLVLLGGNLWLPDVWVRVASDYHTQTGEQKALTLADGSTVYLDTDSAVSVDFSAQARRLVLHRGRALFVVSADKRRPFDVVAANGRVRALGTAFEVYKKPDQVVVTVLESKVRVSRAGSAARLSPGQRIHYGSDAGLSAVDSVDRSQIAAWRRGKLVFNDRSLGEVIEEVNRYRKGAIFILDRKLRASRVSGIFDTGNPDAVLQALEETLPIRLRRLTRYLILLDRIEPPAPAS